MSGDVQPRKRKDKKKKKEELGIEEPLRGTSAIFGEGDVFMHSQHDHGTGGHWCAKVIFFALLAILLSLIGLIILENRGLSELEANQVQSQYSGVLEGWLEDPSDDDHHDIHTLELKHHDNEADSDEHDEGFEDDDEDHEDEEHGDDEDEDDEASDEHGLEDDEDEQNSQEDEDHSENQDDDDDYEAEEQEGDDRSPEEDNEDDQNENDDLEQQNSIEDDDDELDYQKHDNDDDENNNNYNNADDDDNNADDDDDDNGDDDDGDSDDEIENRNQDDDFESEYQTYNNNDSDEDDENSKYNEDEEEDNDEHDDEDDEEVEVEHIEQEASDEEPIKVDLPALPEEDDDDANSQDDDDDDEKANDDDEEEDEIDNDDDDSDAGDDDDDEFLDNDVEPVVERISAPAGKPFVEVDEDDSTEAAPVDTLADEEEYEKRQEELRKEQEQASHMWLKVGVGAALLVATHAVVRRATGPRDQPEETEDPDDIREETPIADRRMTLIPEQAAPIAPAKKEELKPNIQQEISRNIPFIIKSSPTPLQRSLEEEDVGERSEDDDNIETIEANNADEEYSDEEVEEEEIKEKIEAPTHTAVAEAEVKEPEESEPDDDVEIIDDEQIEEELIDEEDEEDISDVDDAELLSRLEAKYGRLPENEVPKKDGGNSVEDSWPGEPNDAFWREELHKAEEELRQGAWSEAMKRASTPALATSCRARLVIAKCLDHLAEENRDNKLLTRAIAAYINVLKMADSLSDERLLEITNRTLNRIQFRGTYLSAEPVHKLLMRRFPQNVAYRNNLTITYLMANRADLAEEVLKQTLSLWPEDRIALAHYGFVLKTQHNRYEEAVYYLTKALEGDTGPATEPRFYYHLGDTLLLLGRFEEAHEVHKRGAAKGHFLSPAQRSLYNVDRLKGRPWWSVQQTPYSKLVEALERNWRDILKEGEAARALYEEEKEGLRAKGEWSQLDLFARGREVPGRCARAPVTCSIVKAEAAAAGCSRGQIKFSAIEPGTRVRPHVGPTNCRLRMHLGLKNTEGTFLRVHKETRQWQVGKVWIFDDSFEHEVWHNGTGSRLVLIVDVWHPQLTPNERRVLPPI